MDPAFLEMFKSVGVDPTKLSNEQLNMMSKMYDGLLTSNPKVMEEIDNQIVATKSSPKKSTKINRNEKCSCGSGKKYKKCCL
jgi:uncharacterized protein YecA (UPF0149 family)